MGLDRIDREHSHMFDRAGDGTRDHELPEMEAVVGRYGDLRVEIWGLWDWSEIGILELGCGVCGHGFRVENA